MGKTLRVLALYGTANVLMLITGFKLGMPDPVINIAAYLVWVFAVLFALGSIAMWVKAIQITDGEEKIKDSPSTLAPVLAVVMTLIAAAAGHYGMAVVMTIMLVIYLTAFMALRELWKKAIKDVQAGGEKNES